MICQNHEAFKKVLLLLLLFEENRNGEAAVRWPRKCKKKMSCFENRNERAN